MDDLRRLYYRIEEEVTWSGFVGMLLAGGVLVFSAIQAIWAPLLMNTFLCVTVFATFLFVVVYQRCLERVRVLTRAVAFADDEERALLLTLEDEA